MNEKTIIKLWAITLIAFLEVVNMLTLKLDGAIFSLVLSAISGIAGYELGKQKEEKENGYFWTTYQSARIKKRK